MIRWVVLAIGVVSSSAAMAEAQTPSGPLPGVADAAEAMFRGPRGFILRAAEKMPDEYFAFRPTPEVRSFGEILGHIADGYTLVCGMAIGDTPPANIYENEKTKKTKAELVAALKSTAEYCDKVHARLTGDRGAEQIDFARARVPRITVLFSNAGHAWEHYGNLVTYMRLKGIVPPSSEPRTSSR
jgi:uncharacterized damage-inducible protein DinB